MTALSLLYSDEAGALRSSVRAMLARHCAWQDVLARTESAATSSNEVWRRLDALGCLALPVAQDQGGSGAGWSEVAVVAEELGRVVADLPFLTSAVLSTAVAADLDDSLLTSLVRDGRVATIAASWSDPVPSPATRRVRLSDGTVDGSVPLVAGALDTDLLLVPVGDALVAVAADDASIMPVTSLDMTRPLADVRFEASPCRPVASGPAVAQALAAAGRAGSIMLAAEQLGLAERALELTVQYAKERYQFGRPIGSYQANKHRYADLWVRLAEARAVARYAAACLADDLDDLPVAASLAQVVCSRLAVDAAAEMIQTHAGIGFTWEHPAHLYLKRARADATALGSVSWHRAELGRLLELSAQAD